MVLIRPSLAIVVVLIPAEGWADRGQQAGDDTPHVLSPQSMLAVAGRDRQGVAVAPGNPPTRKRRTGK